MWAPFGEKLVEQTKDAFRCVCFGVPGRVMLEVVLVKGTLSERKVICSKYYGKHIGFSLVLLSG